MMQANQEFDDAVDRYRSCKPERIWNAQQKAILDDCEHGSGDLVVIARAGTGKTTTMLAGCERFPRGSTIGYLAFNTRMKEEVQAKAPLGIDVRTFHSLGRGALAGYARGKGRRLAEVDEKKTPRLVHENWPELFVCDGAKVTPVNARAGAMIGALCVATSFAKNILLDDVREVSSIVARLNLDIGTEPDDEVYTDELAEFSTRVVTLLARSCSDFRDALAYDFDDMIYIPVAMGWRVKQYDRLIVDEGQDLNPCQHRLARMARKTGGRIILVGDDRQAIYAWRGADEDGIGRFQRDLDARVLRLPVTYRCGRAIVDMAKKIVPDYEAAVSNKPGTIEKKAPPAMLEAAQPADAILSRLNAPLIGHCLALLKAGKRARVVGRDVAKQLMTLIDFATSHGAHDVPTLVEQVDVWRQIEVARIEARDADPEPTHDRADCLLALTEEMETIDGVRERIQALFRADDATEQPMEIVLSSTHKAKGLEWETVYLLEDTYRPGSSTEEDNLLYVGITRAIERLVLVSDRYAVAPPVAPAPQHESLARRDSLVDVLIRGATVECRLPKSGEDPQWCWRIVS